MGTTIVYVISPYTFLMGVLWFNVFTLLGLLVRKLKHPLKFSVVPLVVLLAISLVRMFLIIEFPVTRYIESEVIFPAIISVLRYELFGLFGSHVSVLNALLFVWFAVAAILLIRYAIRCVKSYRQNMALTYARDYESEKVLEKITGCKKRGRIFRTFLKVPFTVGFKPYIFLPDGVDFTRDELRTILRHEWKHIEGKDMGLIVFVNVLSFIFWWNPLAYILKKNVLFALELRCDYYAIAESEDDYQHLMDGVTRFCRYAENSKPVATSLVSSGDEIRDRLRILRIHNNDKSRKKKTLAAVGFYMVVAALFVFSYAFLVLPAHWESPDIVRIGSIEYDLGCYDREEAFQAQENYIVDNGDGTFSLYIDGQYLFTRDNTHDGAFAYLPIRQREGQLPFVDI